MAATSREETQDFVVIGAGMSGLWAAYALARAGASVLVLEARDRKGGRINTFKSKAFPQGVDCGASFIHGNIGNPLTTLAKGLNIELYRPEEDAKAPAALLPADNLNEKQTSILFRNLYTVFFENLKHYAQRSGDPSEEEDLLSFALSSESGLYADLASDSEKTVIQRMIKAFTGWCGADLSKVSLRYFGFERETEGFDAIVVPGYNTMIDWVAKQFESLGGRILLDQEVVSIQDSPEQGIIEVQTRQGQSYKAKQCICTLPLGVLKKAPPKFDPPLPPRRLQAIERLGFGLLNKVILTYPQVWWGKASTSVIIPDKQYVSGIPSLENGAIYVQSYADIGKATLMLFLGGTFGEELEKLENPAKLFHKLLSVYMTTTTETEIPEPLECVVTKWNSDQFAYGSYTYVPKANGQTKGRAASPLDMVELARPLYDGRLGFAGEHTHLDKYACVHGALLSGQDEAHRAGSRLGFRVPGLEQLMPQN